MPKRSHNLEFPLPAHRYEKENLFPELKKAEASWLVIKGAGHNKMAKECAEEIADKSLEWFDRYL